MWKVVWLIFQNNTYSCLVQLYAMNSTNILIRISEYFDQWYSISQNNQPRKKYLDRQKAILNLLNESTYLSLDRSNKLLQEVKCQLANPIQIFRHMMNYVCFTVSLAFTSMTLPHYIYIQRFIFRHFCSRNAAEQCQIKHENVLLTLDKKIIG